MRKAGRRSAAPDAHNEGSPCRTKAPLTGPARGASSPCCRLSSYGLGAGYRCLVLVQIILVWTHILNAPLAGRRPAAPDAHNEGALGGGVVERVGQSQNPTP